MIQVTETDYTAGFLVLSFALIMAGALAYHVINQCLPPKVRRDLYDGSKIDHFTGRP